VAGGFKNGDKFSGFVHKRDLLTSRGSVCFSGISLLQVLDSESSASKGCACFCYSVCSLNSVPFTSPLVLPAIDKRLTQHLDLCWSEMNSYIEASKAH
jgi:hypothetical protein